MLPSCKMEVKEIRINLAKSDNQAIAAACTGSEFITTSALTHCGNLRDTDVIERVVRFIQG